MLQGWSCSNISEGAAGNSHMPNLVLRTEGKAAATGPNGCGRKRGGHKGGEGFSLPRSRVGHRPGNNDTALPRGAGEPGGGGAFGLRSPRPSPLLPPARRSRQWSPSGLGALPAAAPSSLSSFACLTAAGYPSLPAWPGKASGQRSKRSLSRGSPDRNRGGATPYIPPPLTILPPGPHSSLRRRRRCQGNRGAGEGLGAGLSAAVNRCRLTTGTAPPGSASAAAGSSLRSQHGTGSGGRRLSVYL